jgi:hypothetical protein
MKYNNVFCLIDDVEKRPGMHVNNHRFFAKQKYLHALPFTSDYLLLCDFRDVLFQKNIETYPFDSSVDLYGFLEGIKINQDMKYNTFWLQSLEKLFNENFYDAISNNNVICCGTTIGNVSAIRKYVDRMCDTIIKHNINLNLDQGIHNYMFYLNKLDNITVKLLSNEDNLVNTVGCDVQAVNEQGHIVNKNNEVSYIVHQYDRFSLDLKQKINAAYGFNFTK